MTTNEENACATIGFVFGAGLLGPLTYGFTTYPVLATIIAGGIVLTLIAIGVVKYAMGSWETSDERKGLVTLLIIAMGIGFFCGFTTKPVPTAYVFSGVVVMMIVVSLVWKLAVCCISRTKDPATEPLLADVEAQRRAAGPVAVEAIGSI